MKLPPKLGSAQALVTKEIWNDLIDYIRSLQIVPSVNIMPRVTSQGTYLVASKSQAAGVTSRTFQPWDILDLTGIGEPDDDGIFPNYEASIMVGTAAGLLPANIFEGGGLKLFTVPSSLQKWKAKCLTNGKQITSVEVVVDANDPPEQILVPTGLPSEAWFIFGLTLEGVAYRTIGQGNPIVSMDKAIVTDKTQAPPPGVPGVDRWYSIDFR